MTAMSNGDDDNDNNNDDDDNDDDDNDDDSDGATGDRIQRVRPQHAMLWPQFIISSSLFSCSGARIKDDVFQLWLNFNSYASPTHPLYVQDYCDVTGPGYGVTVIMVTVKKGSQ